MSGSKQRYTFISFPYQADGSTKSHVVPNHLKKGILEDLEKRGARGTDSVEDTDVFHLDFGGMMAMNTPEIEVTVDNLKISVMTTQVEVALAEINDLLREKVRYANGKPYYKLHGWLSCLVIEPSNLKHLRNQLAAKIGEAERRQKKFEADRRSFGLPGSHKELLEEMEKNGTPIISIKPFAEA